jgi:PTS system nitrogen regulatory IIA component
MEIVDFLHPQDIILRLEARSRREVLREVSVLLAKRSGVPADAVLSALLKRENLGSTGLGNGIAVPHALSDEFIEPAAALVVLQHPVCFRAGDDQPVDILVAAISPRRIGEDFTPALSRMCRLLLRREVADGIRRASSPADVLGYLQERSAQTVVLPPRMPIPPAWTISRVAQGEGR